MKALARRAKGAFAVGLCSMIAVTCCIALGQATPDRLISVPEPQTWLSLATGLVLMIIVARVLNRRSRDIA